MCCAAEALHGRARPVGGQLQHGGSAGEPLAPPGELAVELRARQPLALPVRRSRRTGRAAPAAATAAPRRRRRTAATISRTSTPMDQPSETMWWMVSSSGCSRVAQPQQGRAQQRARGEVEADAAAAAAASRGGLRAARGLAEPGEIDQRQGGRRRRGDHLVRPPVDSAKVVRSPSWRRDDLGALAASAGRSSTPSRRTSEAML